MTLGRVEYSIFIENGDFDVEATVDGHPIGHVRSVRQGDRLLLADIVVVEKVPRNWPAFPRLLRFIFGDRTPLAARGMGIGRELLKRLLQHADATGVREIWGSMTHEDIGLTPHLLAWYERNGFALDEPDAECIQGAVKKMVRRRS